MAKEGGGGRIEGRRFPDVIGEEEDAVLGSKTDVNEVEGWTMKVDRMKKPRRSFIFVIGLM